MKTKLKIELKTTRILNGYGLRIYVDNLKTKYYAAGGGYDKVSNVLEQFINDNFKDTNSFDDTKYGIEGFKSFIEFIDGTFEIINQKKNIYFITFNSLNLKDYTYKITKNSKDKYLLWANDRVIETFFNIQKVEKFMDELT